MYVVQEKTKCNHKKMHMIIKLCCIICMENNGHMLFKMSNCYNSRNKEHQGFLGQYGSFKL